MSRSRTLDDPGLGPRLLQVLSDARTAEAARQGVLRTLAESEGAPLALLWLIDEPTGELRWGGDWAAESDGDLDAVRRALRRLTFARGVGFPGAILSSRAPAWMEDLAAESALPRGDLLCAAGLRSAVGAPLDAPTGALGVIELFGRTPHVPSRDELSDVMMAGRQLASFLSRLGVEDRLRAVEESNASILDAALDCVVTMDHHGDVLEFNPAATAVFGYAREEAIGRRLAELIIPPDLRDAHEQALASHLAHGTTRVIGRRLEVPAMRADGSIFPAELSVSRLGKGEPPVFVGFVRDLTERRRLEEEQARLLREALLARAKAEAAEVRTDDAREEAERARAESDAARERIAVLARVGSDMAVSMEWETTLRDVVRTAVPAIADGVALTVLEPSGRLRTVAISHVDPERERLAWDVAQRYPPSREARTAGVASVVRSGAPEVVADIDPEHLRAFASDEEHARLLSGLDMRHNATVPLRTAAGVVGVFTFWLGSASGRRFSVADIDLIANLAARTALYLQNARLYSERSHIVRTFQASLRPRELPAVPGAQLAARFQPAGEQHDVGGDFYDVFASGERVWTAVVGDVSGKGAEAATLTALARHTLRATSMLLDDPAANLELLNRALHRDSPAGSFCTVLYARLCPADDGGLDVRFANGGHPGPLLLRPDGTVESIESGRGPLVGALAEATFAEASLHLDPGDLLLFYTDGVTEVRTSDPDLGERELRATLQAHAGASPERIVSAVRQRAVELQAGAQRDDIALVAIKADTAGT